MKGRSLWPEGKVAVLLKYQPVLFFWSLTMTNLVISCTLHISKVLISFYSILYKTVVFRWALIESWFDSGHTKCMVRGVMSHNQSLWLDNNPMRDSYCTYQVFMIVFDDALIIWSPVVDRNKVHFLNCCTIRLSVLELDQAPIYSGTMQAGNEIGNACPTCLWTPLVP